MVMTGEGRVSPVSALGATYLQEVGKHIIHAYLLRSASLYGLPQLGQLPIHSRLTPMN